MCAAVIGRQLRQQAVSDRSSRTLLPTQIPFGKNRPRAPSHALIPPRPHSPVPPSSGGNMIGNHYPAFVDHNQVEPTVITFPIQAPSDRLNVTSKLTTGGAINAVVAQREQRALANQLRKLDMQRTSPKLRCTWHCFCVALKALSGGLILLIVGTIMSVFGFLMENEQKQNAKLNPQSVTPSSEELNSRIRNLTYAGPVIMGLGGIVIVAALLLTFEVRDTLGIKEPAPGQREGNIIVEKKQQKPKNLISVEKQQQQPNQQVDNSNKDENNIAQQEDGSKPTSKQLEELSEADKLKEQFNQINGELNNNSNGSVNNTATNIPMQVCTIENELRKLSTGKQGVSRAKSPPDTLQLTTKLSKLDSHTGKTAKPQEYRHSKHRLSQPNHRSARPASETLPMSRKDMRQMSMQRDILETNLDHSSMSNNALTTEHSIPVTDRHLSMSYSLDSNTLTTTDHQHNYFGNLHSPQDTELSDTEEPSELCSLSLPPTKRGAKNADARCSCTASPEQNDEHESEARKADHKDESKSRRSSSKQSSLMDSQDLNYRFVEQQQKMQQQLIVQQQILLQQQQQLTNLLQEKFHIQQHPHSIETSTPMNRSQTTFGPQHKAISFDQKILSKHSPTDQTRPSFKKVASGKPTSMKSLTLNSSFEASTPRNLPKSTSNNDLITDSKSKSIASIESDSLSEPSHQQQFSHANLIKSDFKTEFKNNFKSDLMSSSNNIKQQPHLKLSSSSKSLASSAGSRPKAPSNSSQNLEFNINMSETK